MRTSKNSIKLGKLVQTSVFALGAVTAVFYGYIVVAAATALPDLDQIGDNLYARTPVHQNYGLGSEFRKEWPFLNAALVQLNWTTQTAMSGTSVEAEYSKKWELSPEVLQSLRSPGRGTYALLIGSCTSLGRNVFGQIVQAQPGSSAKEAMSSDGFFGFPAKSLKSWTRLTEVNADFNLISTKRLPWWHVPTHREIGDVPSQRAELSQEFPGLDLDCQAVGKARIELQAVLQQLLPEVTPAFSKRPQGWKPDETSGLGRIGLGAAKVSYEMPEGTGPWVALEFGTNDSTEANYRQVVSKFSAVTPPHLTVTMHQDGVRTLKTAFEVKDGAVDVRWTHDGTKGQLHISVRSFVPAVSSDSAAGLKKK